jgi:hypothetical protein
MRAQVGHARQVGQGGGNEHDARDAAPAVGRPPQPADRGRASCCAARTTCGAAACLSRAALAG